MSTIHSPPEQGPSAATPEWLTRHGGELRPGTLGHSWFVVIDGAPQYRLALSPAKGRHSCRITQTVNGRFIGCTEPQPTSEQALQAGLELLRTHLGW